MKRRLIALAIWLLSMLIAIGAAFLELHILVAAPPAPQPWPVVGLVILFAGFYVGYAGIRWASRYW